MLVDGILYSFGGNTAGQLGHSDNLGAAVANELPTQIMTDVAQVAAGAYHSMALKTDGTLWTFGDNLSGQLGTLTNSGTPSPNPVPTQVLSGVSAIAAGAFHSLAVKNDGSLWAWGYNWEGELGLSVNNEAAEPNPVPTQVPIADDIAVVAAGDFHSLALDVDGDLWTFGWNIDGQLGHSTNAGLDEPNPTPTQVLTGLEAIAAGGGHSLVVTDASNLLTFGWNRFGQLGHTTNSGVDGAPPNSTPTQVLSGVAVVEAGDFHSLARKNDGSLWTFGLNLHGQLGHSGNFETENVGATPTMVASGVAEVAAGGSHSLMLTNGGDVLGFGDNTHGQLGEPLLTGGEVVSAVPIAVDLPEYRPGEPRRLLDSRPGSSTIDGLYQGIGLRPAGSTTQLVVADRGGVAPVAAAVVLNVTVTGALGNGYVTVFPCGSALPTASNLNYRAGSTVPNAVVTEVGSGGKVCLFTSQSVHVIVDAAGYFPVAATYESVGPSRLLDSRPGSTTVDGTFRGIGQRAAGSTLALQVSGRAGIDVDAQSVVLNVTVVQAVGQGYITVYPCGSSLPNASNINFQAGVTTPNSVISKLGADGKVCIFTSAATHLVADASGFFPDTTGLHSLQPARLMDTRSPGSPTVDHLFEAIGLRSKGSVTNLAVAGRGGVPAEVGTAVLNVTVANAQSVGFVTVFPCGSPLPNASNLNYGVGSTLANLVVTKVGSAGEVCLFTSQAVNLIVDVAGYYGV